MRCMNLSSEVQVTSDDDRFILAMEVDGLCGWRRISLGMKRSRNKTTILLDELFTRTLQKLSLISGLGMMGKLHYLTRLGNRVLNREPDL